MEIPVHYHVERLLNSTSGSDAPLVTLEQIQAQNDALNVGYAGTGFSFVVAQVTSTVNTQWASAEWLTPVDVEMRKALHTGGLETLNVYVLEATGGVLGTASLPLFFWDDVTHDRAVDNAVAICSACASMQ